MTQPHGEYRQQNQQPYPYAPSAPPSSYAVQPYQPMPYSPAPVRAGYAPVGYAPRFALVSAGGRLGARLLDGLLLIVTLGIGWLVWSFITWSDGQTPAKRLLGHVVADVNTGAPFGWGRMAVRALLIDGLLGWVLNVVSFGIYFWVDSLMVFGDRQRTLHDRMAGSVVRHV